MSLESLRISECPAAFAEFARKHNALAALLAAAQGMNGIKVTVAENNLVVEIETETLALLVARFIDANTASIADKILDIAYTASILAAEAGEFDAVINQIISDRFTIVPVATCDPGGTINVVTEP